MQAENFEKGVTRIYYLGGTGLDVASYMQLDSKDVNEVYVDTCNKNVTDSHDNANLFITEGTRGAGKDRRAIMPKIRPQIASILQRFPPADFNILVFGTSGGSGSSLAALILSQMLNAGETVVCVGVSGIESTEVLDNSIATLKTLEGIASKSGLPVLLKHIRNSVGVTFQTVDLEVCNYLEALCLLSSQQNSRLDVKDIDNWVKFTRKVTVAPQLCELTIVNTRQEASAIPEMLSVANLYSDASQEIPYGTPFVRTTGISNDESLQGGELHFVVSTAGIEGIYKDLVDLKAEHHRLQVNFRQRNTVLDIDDDADEDGIVY